MIIKNKIIVITIIITIIINIEVKVIYRSYLKLITITITIIVTIVIIKRIAIISSYSNQKNKIYQYNQYSIIKINNNTNI